jgi:hypothetical protein
MSRARARGRLLAAVVAVVICSASGGVARAANAVFSIAIGFNGAPAGEDSVRPLRFADDDAASFHELARGLADRSYLLTVLDTESQRRFPTLAAEAISPTLAELRRVVAEVGAAVDAARGDPPTVLIFYSGHGTGGGKEGAALTLLDGALTRDVLYDEVLARLHARFIHVFIDACHAEAILRPRDRQAEIVTATPREVGAYLEKETMARFPHVGAVVASTAGAQAHEWDRYGSGIFTHELLSALRGAADVDGNRRIEYSEIAAFITAANRAVGDPRARPQVVVRAPPLDPRAPIVDLGNLRGVAFLRGRPASLGTFSLEDARGNRILDMRADRGYEVALAVPAEDTLYLRTARGESVLRLKPHETVDMETLPFTQAELRSRDALNAALRRGLFATEFGPAYYRGFVDRSDDLLAVDVPDPDPAPGAGGRPAAEVRRGPRAATAAGVASGVLAVTAGVLGGVAWQARRDFDRTTFEADAAHDADRYRLTGTLSVAALVAAALSGCLASYLYARDAHDSRDAAP